MSDTPQRSVNDLCHDSGFQVVIVEWTTRDEVLAALGVTPYDTVDTEWLDRCVAATNNAVSYWRGDLTTQLDQDVKRYGPFAPDFNAAFASLQKQLVGSHPMIRLGAQQLAMRWYRRRNADESAAFNEFGGPPPTIDRDIEQLLCIGRYFHPAIA